MRARKLVSPVAIAAATAMTAAHTAGESERSSERPNEGACVRANDRYGSLSRLSLSGGCSPSSGLLRLSASFSLVFS